MNTVNRFLTGVVISCATVGGSAVADQGKAPPPIAAPSKLKPPAAAEIHVNMTVGKPAGGKAEHYTKVTDAITARQDAVKQAIASKLAAHPGSKLEVHFKITIGTAGEMIAKARLSGGNSDLKWVDAKGAAINDATIREAITAAFAAGGKLATGAKDVSVPVDFTFTN